MIEQSPGVRRLCVCVAAPRPGLLASACRTGGFGRLYTEYVQADGIEMGFASPGADEAMLVTDLIPALHAAAAEASGAWAVPHHPALAVFHVGITRVEGDDLRGAAFIRIRELLRELALVASSDAMPRVQLVVGISSGLFDDVGSECDFTDQWIPLDRAGAWFRGYGSDRPDGGRRR